MRIGIHLLALTAFLMNCTRPVSKEISSEDTLKSDHDVAVDTVHSNNEGEEDAGVTEVSEDNGNDFALMVQESFDSALAARKSESVYALQASFQGYESSADATYYYDSTLALTYCEIMWSMEGTSGTNTYIFSADQAEGGKEELSATSSDEITVFLSDYHPRYGFTRTMMAEADEETSELDEQKFISKRSEVSNEYNRLVARMLEYAQSMVVDDTGATLELENEVDYGETFTERESFRLDKPVYEMLIVDVD